MAKKIKYMPIRMWRFPKYVSEIAKWPPNNDTKLTDEVRSMVKSIPGAYMIPEVI